MSGTGGLHFHVGSAPRSPDPRSARGRAAIRQVGLFVRIGVLATAIALASGCRARTEPVADFAGDQVDHPAALNDREDLGTSRSEPGTALRDETGLRAGGPPVRQPDAMLTLRDHAYPGYAPASLTPLYADPPFYPFPERQPGTLMRNPLGTPYGYTPAQQVTPLPLDGDGGFPIAGGTGEPPSVRRLLAALAMILLVGLAAAMAVDQVRRRERLRTDLAGLTVAERDYRSGEYAPEQTTGTWLSIATIGRYGWPAVLILAVAIGPILFLAVLLRGLTIPDWLPVAQLGAAKTLHDVAPYVLALSFGAMIGVAEVVNTFPAFTAEALGTKWAALLVLFNALGTAIVYAIVVAYSSGGDHPLLRVLGIAVGFAVLIRTRFVLARDLRGAAGGAGGGDVGRAGSGEVSLDFGWLYGRFQQLCRQRIERELLRGRRYLTWRLLALYPDTESLRRLAAHAIRTQAPAEAEGLSARLDAICAEELPESITRARIARFIVETGGLGRAGFLIEHSTAPDDLTVADAPSAPEAPPPEP